MRSSPFRALAVAILIAAMSAPAGVTVAAAQQIRGRVVDEQSRSALVEATVTLYAAADSTRIDRAGTAADGFFTVRAPGPGAYRILVERIGYTPVERAVRLGAQRELVVPAFVMQSQAVVLDPITAEGRAQRQGAETAVGFRRSAHLLAAEKLAFLERGGISMEGAVRDLGAGLRVRELGLPNITRRMVCIESGRTGPTFNGGGGTADACDMVAIIIDGVTVYDPLKFFQNLYIRDFESVEFVPAAEAGTQYGMEASARGALVLWTRGRGPHRSSARDDRRN